MTSLTIAYYHLEPQLRKDFRDETILVIGKLEGRVQNGGFTAIGLSDSEVDNVTRAFRRKFVRKSVIYNPSIASWQDSRVNLTFKDGYKLISVEI